MRTTETGIDDRWTSVCFDGPIEQPDTERVNASVKAVQSTTKGVSNPSAVRKEDFYSVASLQKVGSCQEIPAA